MGFWLRVFWFRALAFGLRVEVLGVGFWVEGFGLGCMVLAFRL